MSNLTVTTYLVPSPQPPVTEINAKWIFASTLNGDAANGHFLLVGEFTCHVQRAGSCLVFAKVKQDGTVIAAAHGDVTIPNATKWCETVLRKHGYAVSQVKK